MVTTMDRNIGALRARMIACKASGATVPTTAYGLIKSIDSNGLALIGKPDADSISAGRLVITMPGPGIPDGGEFYALPADAGNLPVLISGTTPAVGDAIGTESGNWYAVKGKTGFKVNGVAGGRAFQSPFSVSVKQSAIADIADSEIVVVSAIPFTYQLPKHDLTTPIFIGDNSALFIMSGIRSMKVVPTVTEIQGWAFGIRVYNDLVGEENSEYVEFSCNETLPSSTKNATVYDFEDPKLVPGEWSRGGRLIGFTGTITSIAFVTKIAVAPSTVSITFTADTINSTIYAAAI